jgi:hypothetical protein
VVGKRYGMSLVFLDDAAGQQRVEMHGEVVDGGAAGFGDVFGARTGISDI